MLRHSGSASNIIDMIKLLDAMGGKNVRKIRRRFVRISRTTNGALLERYLERSKNGVTLAVARV